MRETIQVLGGKVRVTVRDGIVVLLVADEWGDIAAVELDHSDTREVISLLENAKVLLERQISDGSI